MAASDDYITILHVDDGEPWANFLSARLNGPNYGIKTVVKNMKSAPSNDQIRPPSNSNYSLPDKGNNLHDSGRGSRTISDVSFGSEFTDNARAQVFLLSPDMLSSEIFPVDVSAINPRRSVFLFLGVDTEEVRAYFGQFHSHVFNSHLCIIHADEKSITDALVEIIVAYEDQGEGTLGDEYYDEKDIYKRPPSPRQVNSIEKVLPQEICGTDRDVYFLLERAADETLLVVLDKGEQLPVTCVCDRLYKFTLPVTASGEVYFRVECRHHLVGEDSVLVLTKLDKLKAILNEEVNPLSVIAAAMGLNSDDTDSIDDLLASKMQQLSPLKTFREIFPCEEALNNSLTEERADVTYPSLLHFAADMNLQKFCSELLRYPGMLSAAITENKDGDDPSTLAFKKGYTQLEANLIQFVANHKTSDDNEYVPPLAPRPHVLGTTPGYVNVPQTARGNSDLYVPMEDLRDFQKPSFAGGASQRSDPGCVSPVSNMSENVFSDQSNLQDYSDDIDQFSSRNWELGKPRFNSFSTPIKALKTLGVGEEEIKRQTSNPYKHSARSDAPISKPMKGMIPHGVRYPGVSRYGVEQDGISLGSNGSNTSSRGDSKNKVNKITAFFSKIKNKRSASEGENIFTPPRAMKQKSQSTRGDKLKKKSNEESSQERDSGSYSDDENGQQKGGNKPKEFKERDKALIRKRPMSRRAFLASKEHVKDAPKVPDTNRRKESFTSFIENFGIQDVGS